MSVETEKLTFKQRIDAIGRGEPGEPWYKRDTGKTFHKAANKLRSLGMSQDDVIDFLHEMYAAVADEYGC